MHRFDIKTIQNVEIRRKTFKTTQTNESHQIIMHCIDLTSKRSKLLSYVSKRRKWSNYNGLHRFDIKTIQNVEIRRKTFKTTQTNESDQIIIKSMPCIIIWWLSLVCVVLNVLRRISTFWIVLMSNRCNPL